MGMDETEDFDKDIGTKWYFRNTFVASKRVS